MTNKPKNLAVRAVNQEATLYEVASADMWQCRVTAHDGSCIGWAVRQIVEPLAYAIRYLVVYNPQLDERFLLPATFVAGAQPGCICCSLAGELVTCLPQCPEQFTREYEVFVHQQLGCVPYWEEETRNWEEEAQTLPQEKPPLV